MTRVDAAEQASRIARTAAIRGCRRCGPTGWLLAADGTPVDPAVRCDHGVTASPLVGGRDVIEPIHGSGGTSVTSRGSAS